MGLPRFFIAYFNCISFCLFLFLFAASKATYDQLPMPRANLKKERKRKIKKFGSNRLRFLGMEGYTYPENKGRNKL